MSKKPEHTQSASVIGEGATLGVIGAGVMGQTLLRGLLSGKLIAHDRVWAGDKNPATCDAASQALGIAVESDFHARVPGADDAERGALADHGYSLGMFWFFRH